MGVLPIDCIVTRDSFGDHRRGKPALHERGSYVQPLLARDLVGCVVDVLVGSWCGRRVGQPTMQRELRHEIREALFAQIELRGLARRAFAFRMAERATLVKREKEAHVVLDSGRLNSWYDEVDETFLAGPCERCGYKVPIPWDHDPSHCDLLVVSAVLTD